jgi:tetratricopeptide (TPR) repeat protein
MLIAEHDAPAALEEYRQSFKISQILASTDPTNLDWQFDLAAGHSRIADAESASGDKQGALADYRAALDIIEKLAAADPGNAGWQWNLFASYYQLAEAGDDPMANYRARLTVLERLNAVGQLPAANKPWMDKVRRALEPARK